MDIIKKYFLMPERHTNYKIEIIAGFITYISAIYAVVVHPAILSETGMDRDALVMVTCIAFAIGSLLSAFLAKAPLILGPGMGLNAFFTYTLVLGQGIAWQTALGIVFLSGVFFFILTATGLRKKILSAIPQELRHSISVGIGLFITFIGLRGMGVIVGNSATLVSLGKGTAPTLLALGCLLLIFILELRKVRGSILISIILSFIVGIVFNIIALPASIVSTLPSIEPIFLKLDIVAALKWSLLAPLFTFLFIDMFDSIGTLIGCYQLMDMNDGEEREKSIQRSLFADSTATIIGALLGTSTVTTYTESGTGIAAGGRTGITSLTAAVLFLITPFFTPLITAIPGYLASTGLVLVGLMIFKEILHLDLKDMRTSIPAFITIFMMPLTYSISIGLSFGFISYVIANIISPNGNKINITLWIITLWSVLNLVQSMGV